MNATNKPANEIRLGALKASIWRNETDNGPRYNTTFCRVYRDGDQWKVTEGYGREDLLLLAKLADLAHSWIYAQAREASGATPVPGPTSPSPAQTQPTAAPPIPGGRSNPGPSRGR